MDDRGILTMAAELEAHYRELDIPAIEGLIRHLAEVGIDGEELIKAAVTSILGAVQRSRARRREGLRLVR